VSKPSSIFFFEKILHDLVELFSLFKTQDLKSYQKSVKKGGSLFGGFTSKLFTGEKDKERKRERETETERSFKFVA
jgi:hypothetical protein